MPVSAPGQTTGFNSVSDYMDANQGTLDREAGDVNSLVGSELDAGKAAADQFAQGVNDPDYSKLPGYSDALAKQNTGQQDAELTKSQGGLQDLLGRTGAGHGANSFDAMLLSAHGGFKGTQDKAQSLHGYLDAASSAPRPPAAPADNSQTPTPQPEQPPPEAPAPGAAEGNGGATFTPAPSTGQPAGTSDLRRRSPFTMGGF